MAYLYHVTPASNLESIEELGLQPSQSSSFGGGYQGHAAGKVFFSDAEPAACWWSKLEQVAFHDHEPEDIIDQLHIPVLLRVDEELLDDLEPDQLGSRDCLGESYFTTEPVDPEHIEVWDGKRWRELGTVDAEDAAARYVVSDTEERDEDEDGDEETWREVELELPEGWQ